MHPPEYLYQRRKTLELTLSALYEDAGLITPVKVRRTGHRNKLAGGANHYATSESGAKRLARHNVEAFEANRIALVQWELDKTTAQINARLDGRTRYVRTADKWV